MSGARPSRPSDAGLAGERTTLAWTRLGLTLLGIPAAVLAYAAGRSVLAFVAAMVAMALGLVVLVVSLRRQRTEPEHVADGTLTPAASLVVATCACIVMLAVSSAFLVGL